MVKIVWEEVRETSAVQSAGMESYTEAALVPGGCLQSAGMESYTEVALVPGGCLYRTTVRFAGLNEEVVSVSTSLAFVPAELVVHQQVPSRDPDDLAEEILRLGRVDGPLLVLKSRLRTILLALEGLAEEVDRRAAAEELRDVADDLEKIGS